MSVMSAASRLCQVSVICLKTVPCRTTILSKPLQKPAEFTLRFYSNETRSGFSRHARRRVAEQIPYKPVGKQAISIGQSAVTAGAVVGLGALCFYGLGLSNQVGAIDTHLFWPQYMKDRIKSTYLYFGASLLATAGSAVMVFRSPVLYRLMSKNSAMAAIATIAALIGSSIIVRSIPYENGIGVKQLAWLGHCGLLGGIIAPLCILGGPLILRAAWYTAGIVGGLSTVAVCAPSDKFLNWAGPLSIGLGVVAAASIGTWFLPATSALGVGVYSVAMYGGLLVFSGLVLYDTQKIIKNAEVYPMYGVTPYDPINASMSIYMDTINLFIRMVMMLAGNRKK